MMNDETKPVRPEKTIVITCKKGSWKATFVSLAGEVITIPDLKRVRRALGHGHRVYIRDITLKLKRINREADEKARAEATAKAKPALL